MPKTTRINVSGGQSQDAYSSKGYEAHNIEITLSESEKQNTIVFSGTHQGEIEQSDTLDLLAKGRNGRDGKNGQNGLDGEKGKDGQNAVYLTPGSNGYPGGDGKNGTPGTDGEDAGPGGSISITVLEKDKALLDVIGDVDVSSGTPGHKGQHGHGGRGGRGGRGGSSTVTNTLSTDYSGKTHLIPHYVSGGHDGTNGHDGHTPSVTLYSGKKSTDGSYKLLTIAENGEETTHTTPYQFGVTLNKPYKSHYEFGETVQLNYLISNSAKTMATPIEHVPVKLLSNNDFKILQHGEGPGNIAPETSSESTKPVIFEIQHPMTISTVQQRAVIATTVHLENTRLNRYFNNVHSTNNFCAEYPVYLKPQEDHLTLEQGKSMDVVAQIRQHQYPELQNPTHNRAVQVKILHQNKLLKELNIKTQEQWTTDQCSAQIMLPTDAELFSTSMVTIDLYLQPLYSKPDEKLLIIQQQQIQIQVAESYHPKGSGFLLVMNANTSPEAIKYWKDELSKLANNNTIDVWNNSLYKHTPWESSTDLINNTLQGTVVILDNSYNQQKQFASKTLNQQVRYEVSQRYGAKFLVVGPIDPLQQSRLTSNDLSWPRDNSPLEFQSKDLFFAHLLQKNKLESKQPNYYKLKIPLSGTSCLSSKKLDLINVTQKMQNKLELTFPNRAYFVDASEQDDCAVLKIQEIPVECDSQIEWINKSSDELSQTHYLKNDQDMTDVISMLPFTQKLQLLFSHSKNAYHHQLAQCLINDLLSEQERLRTTQLHGKSLHNLKLSFTHDFKYELKKLRGLVQCLNPIIAPQFAPLIIRLIAQVQYVAEQHSTFFDKVGQVFTSQVNEEIRLKTKKLLDQLLTNSTGNIEYKKRLEQETHRIQFKTELEQFIKDNAKQSNNSLFSKRLTPKEIYAAKSLICAIELFDENEHWLKTPELADAENFQKNNTLNGFYLRFKQLFPGFYNHTLAIV